MTDAATDQGGGHQQHPLGVYLGVWALLFVLSAFSYMVDYLHLQGMLRWGLILLFMFLKAGFIISIFIAPPEGIPGIAANQHCLR